MKLKRSNSKEPPLRRQRQSSGDRLQVKSSYSYSSRRSEETGNVGRQDLGLRDKLAASSKIWLRRSWAIVIIIVILFIGFKVLSLSSMPKVVLLDTKSSIKLSIVREKVYQAAASKILTRSTLDDNKITVDTNNLSKQLISKFPQLESVDISIPLFSNQPIIYVEPAQPALALVEPSGAYEITDNGRAVMKASNPSALSASNLPILTDQSGLKAQINHQVLPTNDIIFIQTVVGQLAAKGFSLSSMTLPASSEELDVYLAGQKYYVKFNLAENDAKQQAGTFLATIANLQSQKVTPTKYVDVRVDGRAYYQ
jgi:hypothetical protein